MTDDNAISWLGLSELTHETQVARFGFCTCEDNEGNPQPYDDCPTSLEWEQARAALRNQQPATEKDTPQ